VELARALMLAGRDDAVAWCDRVLSRPSVATPKVLLEAIITKGTAVQRLGRMVEAEALLRGAAVIADTQGNLFASLRSRNNLYVMLQDIDLHDALALIREVYELARRYGQKTWVLHGVAATLETAFRIGAWDDYLEEARAELADTEGYYLHWLHAEEARRLTYRSDPGVALRTFEEVLAAPAIVESAQATGWNLAGKADALSAQGRFGEAFDVAVTSWDMSAEVDTGFHAALFAAVADGNTDRVKSTLRRWNDLDTGHVPLQRAFDSMATSLLALLEGRWDEGRSAYVVAEQLMEGVGAGTLLARFRLAFAHLGRDRFPEAAGAAERADAFFAERDALGYTERYRANAFAHPASGVTGPSTARRSPTVRAAG
jgi:hypothetical protein